MKRASSGIVGLIWLVGALMVATHSLTIAAVLFSIGAVALNDTIGHLIPSRGFPR